MGIRRSNNSKRTKFNWKFRDKNLMKNLVSNLHKAIKIELENVALTTQKENLIKARAKPRHIELSFINAFYEK